jgi:endonuclease G
LPVGVPPAIQKLENAKRILPLGFPGPLNDLIYRTAYVASFNRALRNPNWVAEHLTPESIKRKEGVDRENSSFKEDGDVPAMFRAKLIDYFKSGFDRGHMVPAADVKMSQDAMDETFFLTNIAPQVGDGFNRHYWAYLESFARKLTEQFPDVYVLTGPLYLPKLDPTDGKWYVKYQMIGSAGPNVAVPTHFYKVILAVRPNGEASLGAFLLPNAPISDTTPLESFNVPVDAIERSAGLQLLSDEQRSGIKELCRTVKCEIIVRRFDEVKRKSLPVPQT